MPHKPFIKSVKIAKLVEDRFGFGLNYAYDAVCDLARPWLVQVPLVAFHGNVGSPDFPAAAPTMTESRLSPCGALAVEAERRVFAPLPLGLINGTVYHGGSRPSFDPMSMIRAVLTGLGDGDVSERHLGEIVGPPRFPGGCEVDGNVGQVLAGEPGVLVLRARLSVSDDRGRKAIDITNLPPEVGSSMLSDMMTARADGKQMVVFDWPTLDDDEPRLPFAEVADRTHGLPWGDAVLVRCYLEPGADAEECVARMRSEPGVVINVKAHIPGGVGGEVRRWVEEHRNDVSAEDISRLVESLS